MTMLYQHSQDYIELIALGKKGNSDEMINPPWTSKSPSMNPAEEDNQHP